MALRLGTEISFATGLTVEALVAPYHVFARKLSYALQILYLRKRILAWK